MREGNLVQKILVLTKNQLDLLGLTSNENPIKLCKTHDNPTIPRFEVKLNILWLRKRLIELSCEGVKLREQGLSPRQLDVNDRALKTNPRSLPQYWAYKAQKRKMLQGEG